MIPLAYFVLMMTVVILGFQGLPSDYEIQAEYVVGILTASSILFGFWAVLIEKKPGERVEKWLYETVLSKTFFFCFVFLVISVLLTFFTALGKLSSAVALMVCTLSFCENALFVAFHLYHTRFRKSKR